MYLLNFTAHDNCFLHEFDRNKISKYCDSPCSIVPSLQEVVARAIIDFGMVWEIGLLPNHLESELSMQGDRWISVILLFLFCLFM